jgi:uncharacterized protein YndB with AHSA1/START domain
MTTMLDTQSVTMEFDLPHPPAKVWRALTEPELLAKWLMPTDMQPIIGKSFTFKVQLPAGATGWDGIVNCEMKEIEQHKRLRYSWRGGGIDTAWSPGRSRRRRRAAPCCAWSSPASVRTRAKRGSSRAPRWAGRTWLGSACPRC